MEDYKQWLEFMIRLTNQELENENKVYETMSIHMKDFTEDDIKKKLKSIDKIESKLDTLKMCLEEYQENSNEENIIDFIEVLMNKIPSKVWTDENNHIISLKLNKDYGTLKEFFITKMKELFDLDIDIKIGE